MYLLGIKLKQLISLLKIPVSTIFIFLYLAASGRNPYINYTGAGEAGMGSLCVMKDKLWTSFQNQASLAFNNTLSIGFNYENRFNIKELGTRTLGITVPLERASVGIVYSHFGYSDFKRDHAGLACGIMLSDKLSAGVQVDYYSERTSGEYLNNQSVTCEIGIMVMPNEDITLGIHLFNPVPGSLRNNFLPTTLRIGAGIDLNSSLFTGFEVEMSSGSKMIIKTGFEYRAEKNLRIRGGFRSENNSFCFGLGYLLKDSQFDLGFSTHERLGIISSVSLIFKIR